MSNRLRVTLNKCLLGMQKHAQAPCVLCGARSDRHGLCAGCRCDLPRLPPTSCAVCAMPLTVPGVCGACLQRPPRYDAVIAAQVYAAPLDRLIQRYKYGADIRLAPTLAQLLAAHVRSRPDLLIPMPLAPRRLRERGFNPALELARTLARTQDCTLTIDLCRRVIETPPQALLPWSARARNVRRAFVCDGNLRGLTVAVVDDVLTTGATLDELARVLKRAGAARVEGWVVARAVPRLWRRRDDEVGPTT